jgi:hypothetical protein
MGAKNAIKFMSLSIRCGSFVIRCLLADAIEPRQIVQNGVISIKLLLAMKSVWSKGDISHICKD